MSNHEAPHSTPLSTCELPHPFCSGWPLRPSEPYSSSPTLLFVSWNDECYTPGPGHYANPIWFLHALDCTMHLHHIHSHSYSDANDINPNCGTFGIIHTCPADTTGDTFVMLSTGCPSTTTDCKGAARARASCPWLM